MSSNILEAWGLSLLPYAGFFLLVMILDAITGALVAWKEGAFQVEKLTDFLQTGFLFAGAWLTVEILAFAPKYFGIVPEGWTEALANYAPKTIYASFVVLKYGTSILDHIAKIQKYESPWLNKLGINKDRG